MNTAQNILNQIKVQDSYFLANIGAKKFLSGQPNGKHLGFLTFRVSNCFKVSNGTIIKIILEDDNTYTVKAYNVRKVRNVNERKTKVFEEVKDVLEENIVEVIDKVVG